MSGGRFKVGDLVTLKGLQFVVGKHPYVVNYHDGEVGVVTEILPEETTEVSGIFTGTFFFDYCIMIGEHQIFVFDDELSPFPEFCHGCDCSPCDCDWGT